MRALFASLLGLALAMAWFSVALAQQQTVSFDVYASVFSDTSEDGVQDTGELLLDGWTLEIYDDSMTLLASTASSDTGSVALASDTEPSYVCVMPSDTAFQTYPLIGTNYPGDAAWYCHSLAQESEEYLFGVSVQEVEENPDVIEEENTAPVEKDPQPEDTGAVLGATDEPAVLAETGVPAAVVPAVGLSFISLAFSLAKRSKLN